MAGKSGGGELGLVSTGQSRTRQGWVREGSVCREAPGCENDVVEGRQGRVEERCAGKPSEVARIEFSSSGEGNGWKAERRQKHCGLKEPYSSQGLDEVICVL